MKKRWMTLIEIIIALFVFAVGILAVVRVITTNIGIIDTMKVKIQAQSLAKEGIDLVFNIRDTNLERGVDRRCAFINPAAVSSIQNKVPFNGQICGDSFAAGKKFRIWIDNNGRIFVAPTTTWNNFTDTFNTNQLQMLTGGANYTGAVYLHINGQAGSQFARYISFSPVIESWKSLDETKLLKVTSHVLYRKGGIQGETTIESFIWAIKK